jgi:predicted small lipoprotein YifL
LFLVITTSESIMKKSYLVMSALALSFSLTACGKKEEAAPAPLPAEQAAPVPAEAPAPVEPAPAPDATAPVPDTTAPADTAAPAEESK